MSKHSPGPWNVEVDGSGWTIECTPARLIAAAPQMLDALRDIQAHLEAGDIVGERLRAELIGAVRHVIARAEGRS